jgi:hypothetical protein
MSVVNLVRVLFVAALTNALFLHPSHAAGAPAPAVKSATSDKLAALIKAAQAEGMLTSSGEKTPSEACPVCANSCRA